MWRQDVDVFHRSIDADEEPLLAMIAAGAPFDAVCERLLADVPEERGAQRAFEILGRWVTDGLVVRPPNLVPGGGSGSSSTR